MGTKLWQIHAEFCFDNKSDRSHLNPLQYFSQPSFFLWRCLRRAAPTHYF
ncbi:hypothetical protein [Nostoc sp.]